MIGLRTGITKLRNILRVLLHLDERLQAIQFNQGVLLAGMKAKEQTENLSDCEFKVFSQWGEDGIIQRLIHSIEIKNQTFIEFGVEDFSEASCRFLMMKDNWSGFVIDGDRGNIERLKQSDLYWKYDLVALEAFITKDNVNELLKRSGFDSDLGLLSIDLDGNDYFILEAIDFFKPRILICEYNAVFGEKRKISVPYRDDFRRAVAHSSNLYWGASLAAITCLAERKGYALVGTNSAGNNAFYVRCDVARPGMSTLSVEMAYRASNFRESRNAQGQLTFLSGDQRLDSIKGLPVLDVDSGAIEPL